MLGGLSFLGGATTMGKVGKKTVLAGYMVCPSQLMQEAFAKHVFSHTQHIFDTKTWFFAYAFAVA